MYDYHMHSHFSGDCEIPMGAIVQAAVEAGLEEICFTDHIDLEYMAGESFAFDPAEYETHIRQLRMQYRNQITIKMGLEVGLQPHVLDQSRKLIQGVPFDFIIGSLHGCEGQDFFFGDFFEGKTATQAVKTYVHTALQMLNTFSEFDVMGHIDIPKRYSTEVAALDPYEVADIMEPLLHKLIKMGKGLEINTSGWRQDVGESFPSRAILERYYSLGGRRITLGSDSHGTETLCKDFDRAVSLLKEIGFTHGHRFAQRKAMEEPLENWLQR